jgi:hypothetical protein
MTAVMVGGAEKSAVLAVDPIAIEKLKEFVEFAPVPVTQFSQRYARE